MLRNRIVYSCLLVGSSLLAYYLPNIITSIFFHTILFILFISLAHLAYSYAVVKVSQKLEPSVVEHGEKATYTCRIHNEGFLPTCALTINFLFSETMFKDQLEKKSFSLPPGVSSNYEYSLFCRYRGVYSVGIDTMEVTDLLNVFRVKITNIESKNITVLPKITQLPYFVLSPKAESDVMVSSSMSAESANSLVDVRRFEQGDALKHIHWKLSARHNQLLVRNMERSAQNSTLIFLDTSKGKYSFEKNLIIEDKLMEALVSVVNQCIIQKHIIEINYHEFAEVRTVCKNREDFRDFFNKAANLSFMHKVNIKSSVDSYLSDLDYKNNLFGKDIFIFTSHLALLDNLSEIKKQMGTSCALHIVSCSFNKDSEGSYRTSDGIYYYNLSPGSDLQDIFIRSIK
ncbi:MAG: DUF58 domain-containing protein [Clostridia bacterium]|nr:DUF58 domain-containing protein [Clostridia bacterium]